VGVWKCASLTNYIFLGLGFWLVLGLVLGLFVTAPSSDCTAAGRIICYQLPVGYPQRIIKR